MALEQLELKLKAVGQVGRLPLIKIIAKPKPASLLFCRYLHLVKETLEPVALVAFFAGILASY